jgi:hypothetical protein
MIRDHRLYCCDTPAHICALLQGKIFEIPAGTTLTDDQLLLSERQSERGTMLRIATDIPPADAIPVTPGLEDAFLYIYRDVRS